MSIFYNDEFIPREKILCLDIETTGFDYNFDEILQLSIIDGNGKLLFNEYFKSQRHKVWPAAEVVNHITPIMLAKEFPLAVYKDVVDELLAEAQVLVGYNHIGFDIPFLRAAGFLVPDCYMYDVMLNFADVFNERRPDGRVKRQKLIDCAAYYNYVPTGSWHNSLEDVKATLYCFYKMLEDSNMPSC